MDITWHLNDPPLNPHSWYSWSTEELLSIVRTSDNDQLTSVLLRAFAQGLSRRDGWQIDRLPPEFIPLMIAAAAMYKRGVAISNRPGQGRQGHYQVLLANHMAHRSDYLPPTKDCFFVLDQQVADLYPSWGAHADLLQLAAETEKNLDTVRHMASKIAKGHSKQQIVIVGGGMLTDSAAFAAHLLKRPFILVPTTLLAMVDACVGGKTGVNFPPYGKNQLGAFAFPETVVIFPQFLKTLPLRELRSGGAECLKHAFLTHQLSLIETTASFIQEERREDWAELLPQLLAVKAQIIEKDTGEQGVRAYLNLGHTLAHGLEALSQQRKGNDEGGIISHGEAVGIGLAFALQLSSSLGALSPATAHAYQTALERSGCLITHEQLAHYLGCSLADKDLWPSLLRILTHDKKNTSANGQLSWVILQHPGAEPARVVSLTASYVEEQWREILRRLNKDF